MLLTLKKLFYICVVFFLCVCDWSSDVLHCCVFILRIKPGLSSVYVSALTRAILEAWSYFQTSVLAQSWDLSLCSTGWITAFSVFFSQSQTRVQKYFFFFFPGWNEKKYREISISKPNCCFPNSYSHVLDDAWWVSAIWKAGTTWTSMSGTRQVCFCLYANNKKTVCKEAMEDVAFPGKIFLQLLQLYFW